MFKKIIFILLLSAGTAYGGGLATVMQKFPKLQALTAATIIITCSSGCMPKAVDSWLRGTRTAQAQAERIAIGVSAADSERHVFGYDNGYFVGEIISTSESYHTIKLYKHGRDQQISKNAVEAVLIPDHPDIGVMHELATDLVGAMYLRGEVVGVYRHLEHADVLIYAYHVETSIDLGGQTQPHDDTIVFRIHRIGG
ncbi:MAG: hypothetical protein OYH77_02560 [Pseudomonadota bacterium]|nr:hypothetical protein [Pseudomonadota bacterium]